MIDKEEEKGGIAAALTLHLKKLRQEGPGQSAGSYLPGAPKTCQM